MPDESMPDSHKHALPDLPTLIVRAIGWSQTLQLQLPIEVVKRWTPKNKQVEARTMSVASVVKHGVAGVGPEDSERKRPSDAPPAPPTNKLKAHVFEVVDADAMQCQCLWHATLVV